MVAAYEEHDGKFAMSVRSLTALAFATEQDAENAFWHLMTDEEDEEFVVRVQPVADYFDNTWIGRPAHHKPRSVPVFSIGPWNVYQRTCNGEPRTHNRTKG